MRWTNAFIQTLKENPQDAEVVSHKLMVRAGLIRKLTAGAYSYLPLGVRTLLKVKAIIRDEMVTAGAEEVLLPALQPLELWKKTGRDKDLGEVMILWDEHRQPRAWCSLENVKWGDVVPYFSAVEFGLCSSVE